MRYSLEQFAAECHRVLKADAGPLGRLQVSNLLKDVLKDDDFVATYVGDDVSERKVLYEDSELGFVILAHKYDGASDSRPHDHGPSWAIYGQARGETEMTEWVVVEPASSGRAGKVRPIGTTTLKPGMAFVYHEGELHSPRRSGPAKLIRIEGTNLDKVQRLTYEPA